MAVHVSRIFTPFTIYTVTNTLTNVITNNDTTKVMSGKEYKATLTPVSGYTSMSVTVMMGGTNITSTSYSNGVITITEVTGDILITATGLNIIATITGTGSSNSCYAIINGTNQYSAGTHEVNAGDTITFSVFGAGFRPNEIGSLTIDGTEVLRVTNSSTQTYDWIVPDGISTVEIAISVNMFGCGTITVTTA